MFNDIRNEFGFHFNGSDGESVSVNFNAVGLEQILTKFEDFLHGCGYKLNGEVKIIPNTTSQKSYQGSFGSMPHPTSGGITKEQIAALQPINLQSITPLKNEDIIHFGV